MARSHSWLAWILVPIGLLATSWRKNEGLSPVFALVA